MKYFKIKYETGDFKIVKGRTALEIIRKYDLASLGNVNTRLIELEGEQRAIAQANDEVGDV